MVLPSETCDPRQPHMKKIKTTESGQCLGRIFNLRMKNRGGGNKMMANVDIVKKRRELCENKAMGVMGFFVGAEEVGARS